MNLPTDTLPTNHMYTISHFSLTKVHRQRAIRFDLTTTDRKIPIVGDLLTLNAEGAISLFSIQEIAPNPDSLPFLELKLIEIPTEYEDKPPKPKFKRGDAYEVPITKNGYPFLERYHIADIRALRSTYDNHLVRYTYVLGFYGDGRPQKIEDLKEDEVAELFAKYGKVE